MAQSWHHPFRRLQRSLAKQKSACEAGRLTLGGRDIKIRGFPFNLQMIGAESRHPLRSVTKAGMVAVLMPESIRSGQCSHRRIAAGS